MATLIPRACWRWAGVLIRVSFLAAAGGGSDFKQAGRPAAASALIFRARRWFRPDALIAIPQKIAYKPTFSILPLSNRCWRMPPYGERYLTRAGNDFFIFTLVLAAILPFGEKI